MSVSALELGRELADRVGLPLMTHIGYGPPSIDEVVPLLRPGDILTHCFTGGDMRIVDDAGVPNPAVLDLHKARAHRHRARHGIVLLSDGGGDARGRGNAGRDLIRHPPDGHPGADVRPPDDLVEIPQPRAELPDVIERATSRPAAAMRRPDLGTLKQGSVADVAIFGWKRATTSSATST